MGLGCLVFVGFDTRGRPLDGASPVGTQGLAGGREPPCTKSPIRYSDVCIIRRSLHAVAAAGSCVEYIAIFQLIKS